MLKKGKRVFFLPESEIGSCAYKGVALRTAFIFFCYLLHHGDIAASNALQKRSLENTEKAYATM